jgi:dipeptidyl aminopeptidase/acylaminoacyl peptidase
MRSFRTSLLVSVLVAVGLALPVVFLTAQTPPATAKRPMNVDDQFRLVSVGGARLSPDGKWVVFSQSTRDYDKDKSETTWWLAPTDGSAEPFRFIGEEGGSGFTWAPDSRTLYFTRSLDKEGKKVPQIFKISLNGGEALPITDWKESQGSWTLSPDGTFFVLRKDRKDETLEKEIKEGYDQVYVNEGPNGQGRDSWSDLWKYDPKSQELTRLTERDWSISSFDISPDGRRIVFSARPDNLRNTGGRSELYLLTLEDQAIARLTDNGSPEGGPVWLPDGRSIVFEAVSETIWDSGNGDLWLMDVDTADRKWRNLTAAHEGPLGRPEPGPDGRWLYFGGGWGTARWPQRLEVATGRIEDLASSKGLMNVASWSKDRQTYAYTYQDFTTPADLYIGRAGNTTDRQLRLTDANPWVAAEIELGSVELVQWKSRNDFTIEGVLQLPPGYEVKNPRPIPLLLHIHGGPAGSFTNSFSVSSQVYAGLGYAQLSPNVRGSTGYDDKLMRGNLKDIGGGDYQDLMTGVDELIRRRIAHKDSLCLSGWSYGGILGGWTITQTDRFKAASVGAMVSDWTSEYGPGFNYDVTLWYLGGDPWTNARFWRERSALTHVDKVKTPTLVLHGDNDTTDTPAQSMNFFAGLQRFEVPSRYVRFPGEPHGLGKMKHQRTRAVEEIEWFQKWVRGLKDYHYPDRPKPEEEKKGEEKGKGVEQEG